MRIFLYLLWIIFILIAASFALLNANMVTINYFFGEKAIYFPLLMLIILVAGAILGMLALLPKLITR